ncbi:MAG: N-acetyltransferase, partial [Promethearchaeota archaeon]
MKDKFKLENGDIIIIRSIRRSDIDSVWRNFNEVVNSEETPYPIFYPVEAQFEKESWYNTLKRENELCIVAENKDLERPMNVIGQCEVTNIEWDASAHVGNLGIIILNKYRDMGIGYHLIDNAIKESYYKNEKEKIILSCFSTNHRAIHLYKKIGFKKIGLRKNQFKINNTY